MLHHGSKHYKVPPVEHVWLDFTLGNRASQNGRLSLHFSSSLQEGFSNSNLNFCGYLCPGRNGRMGCTLRCGGGQSVWQNGYPWPVSSVGCKRSSIESRPSSSDPDPVTTSGPPPGIPKNASLGGLTL